MRRRHLHMCCMTLFVLWSCKESDSPVVSPETGVPINWSVRQMSMTGTRAVIDNDNELQTACSPDGGGKSIAIWGSHNRSSEAVFKGTLLTYEAKNSTTPHMWNYVGEPDRHWLYSTEYQFLAYYPANLQGVDATSTLLTVGEYNTLSTQEDLMTAYTTVNTGDGTFDLFSPVPLTMQHALASVAFKVKSERGNTLTLKSLQLDGLMTRGAFTYDGNPPTTESWQPDNASAGSYCWNGNLDLASTAITLTNFAGDADLPVYAEEGYILVIPQTCTPSLRLTTGGRTFNDFSLTAEAAGVTYEPGKRYLYTLSVIDDKVELVLTIKEWNERKSSFDYTFDD